MNKREGEDMHTGRHIQSAPKKESFDLRVQREQKLLTEEEIRLAIEAIQVHSKLHAIIHLRNIPYEWSFEKAVAAIKSAES